MLNSPFKRRPGLPWLHKMIRPSSCLLLFLIAAAVGKIAAGQTLPGEFTDIDLGRELVGASRFPTIQELRAACAKPEIETVLMLKLFGDENDHHLPIWSSDGQRLALQRSPAKRSRGTSRASHLTLFDSLNQVTPRQVPSADNAYDYMFRWGLNRADSFIFARIEGESSDTRLWFSADGRELEARTEGGARSLNPTLFVRDAGVYWLVYESGDELIQQAWSRGENQRRSLGEGSAPRFSRDGTRLLIARRDTASGRLGAREVGILELRSQKFVSLLRPGSGIVRSPTWSPDERFAAYYYREGNESSPWRIEVQATDGRGGKKLADNVVVNPDYTSEGPSWEPNGRRIWYFTPTQRDQEYYPLAASELATGKTIRVDYPRGVTTPQDLAVNPVTAVPEFAFVANRGLPRDLFIVFCNHY